MSTPAGYSVTPLAKKLGIAANARVVTKYAPDNYVQLLDPLPPGLTFQARLSEGTDLVHVFVAQKGALAKELVGLRKNLRSNAVVWVSWPKKASKVPTDVP